MIEYTPRGKIREAMLFIDEEGAQFSDALAEHIGSTVKKLPDIMDRAVEKGVVGSVARVRDGKRMSVWHLTPKAEACIKRIRQEMAVAA